MAEFAKYCVSGDTLVHLAGSNSPDGGTISVEALFNRITAPLLPAVSRRLTAGEQPYTGPCVICGTSDSHKFVRGACNACYVWRQKFQDVERGLYGLTVEADRRVRPCRILMVHKHEPAQTYTVTLSDGKQITATANHQHLTPDGLRRVDQLSVGEELVVDAGYEVHRYASGEHRTTVGQRQLVGSISGAHGASNYGYVDGGFASLMDWTAQAPEQCQECGHDGSDRRLERAHLDGNHANNDWANLAMLCVSCHKRHDYAYNGRRRRWGKGHPTQGVQIVSIEPRAVEPVYSVVMDDPHIWIANGIATSNSFNKAHAFGYAVLGYWTAWLKFHYPVQFLTAALSTVDDSRIPEFVNEARRMGYSIKGPDINASGVDFTPAQTEVRFGLLAVSGVGLPVAEFIVSRAPYASFEDFVERAVEPTGSPVNRGHLAALVSVGAFDSLVANRRAVEMQLEAEKNGDLKRCTFLDLTPMAQRKHPDAPAGCTFDWPNEKDPPLLPRGRGKDKTYVPKPPPKRCTSACRQYTRPEPMDHSAIEPYTIDDIMEREKSLLGVYLSGTPFDRIPAEYLDLCATAAEVEASGPGFDFTVAAIVEGVRERTDVNGGKYAFVTLDAQGGTLDVICFASVWDSIRGYVRKDALVVAVVAKNSRGLNLLHLVPAASLTAA